ncbi:hypothetical protein U9M48_026882 [Paspalum notatum var. saurae]|uniref:SWIM-type domain-containing protein n=1 Tax=Paspalum notatum var. saurae TaxID=547442 RepID=A0AAQ3WZE4_PASNO
MAFRSSRQFKKALVKYGLKTRRQLLFVKDEANKVRATCSWKGCNWLIYGSKTSRFDWFKVVTFVDEHQCPPRRDNKLVTSNRIAEYYYNEIKDNPTWKVELMKKAVLRDMMADVFISKCKRAKALVLKEALDSMRGEYSKVYDYQMELLRSNPGSTVVVCLDPEFEEKVFERMYICFDACKKGFLAGCRRVIGVDGCWFKGATNGNLLCAIGRDANNQIYPIAWAAVATETYDSWYWFLGLLQKDLNINNGGEGWVIISDQQKGLLKAVAELILEAEHRMCARHIYANWRKKHTDKELQKKWWCCAKSHCRELINYHKAVLAQETPEGAQDMMRTSPQHWSRAFFRIGSNCDLVDNNMCESFNNSIMDAMFYPVISMHEAMRKKVMVSIQENRARAKKWVGTICPNIFKKLKINIERSSKCDVLWNGKEGFEVQENAYRRYIVNLVERTCTCRSWQISGLPCCHAISCIYKTSKLLDDFLASKLLDDFIAPCFTKAAYMRTYDHVLQPVEGPGKWPISDMPRPLPPAYVKMPGRPKTQRRREPGEAPKGSKLSKVGTKIKCRLCDMPRPLPPAYVKMPGRPKTQRRREPGEAPKGSKLSKVGTKIKCRLCGKYDHNARTCSKNADAGKKKNAYIKRDAARKRKAEPAGPSKRTKGPSLLLLLSTRG